MLARRPRQGMGMSGNGQYGVGAEGRRLSPLSLDATFAARGTAPVSPMREAARQRSLYLARWDRSPKGRDLSLSASRVKGLGSREPSPSVPARKDAPIIWRPILIGILH